MPTPVLIARDSAPEYSGCSAFNADNSRILVLSSNRPSVLDHFQLLDGTGKSLAHLPIAASQEPRWDRVNPNVFYFVDGNTLRSFNVATNQTLILHVFSEYVSHDSQGRHGVYGEGESDISADNDHFVLRGIRPDGVIEVFVYSLKNGKGTTYPQTRTFDGLKITPSNHIILSRELPGDPINEGLWDITANKRITTKNGHAAVTRYKGRDVVLFHNTNENPVIAHDYPNGVVMVDVDTVQQKGLKSFPWGYSLHIAVCDRDFCVVSTDSSALPMQLWKVPLDGTASTVICDTGGKYRDYSSQPKASLSRDGSRAVFSVDDGSVINAYIVQIDTPPVIPPPVVPPPPPISTAVTDLGPVTEGQEFRLKVQNGRLVKV